MVESVAGHGLEGMMHPCLGQVEFGVLVGTSNWIVQWLVREKI